MPIRSTSILCCAFVLALPIVVQADPPSKQSLKDPACNQTQTAASGPAPKSADGTAPGNSGTTGFTGGLGGAYIGTNPNGTTPASKSFQPATARGLDPIGAPQPSPRKC